MIWPVLDTCMGMKVKPIIFVCARMVSLSRKKTTKNFYLSVLVKSGIKYVCQKQQQPQQNNNKTKTNNNNKQKAKIKKKGFQNVMTTLEE